MTRVRRRRPTADYDDLGYVGCRIVPPIRIAERRPFARLGVGLSLIICWAIAVLSRRRVKLLLTRVSHLYALSSFASNYITNAPMSRWLVRATRAILAKGQRCDNEAKDCVLCK